jgi:S-ribosylhomocysteine lyase
MKKIASFTVDHNKLDIGMYISRIDGDIITYDIRMVKPNGDYFMSTGSMHTIEHLFATYARNSALTQDVIYVGPMGCRTGFYLILRGEHHKEAIALVRDAFEFIKSFEGDIPGNSAAECGNYKDHDLSQAKKDILPLLQKLQKYNKNNLQY